ncbi:MAG: hypothetical protein AB7O48_09065 [Cyclobacteriaceae bacterium]
MKLSGLLILLLALPLLSTSCKKDDPDPLEERIKELTASWKLGTVTNNNQDVSDQYTGFTLTVAGNNYTTTNGGNPWPASGSYEMRADNLNTIIRSDGTVITIDEISSSTLVLSFNHASLSTGRVNGVTGSFTFLLVK